MLKINSALNSLEIICIAEAAPQTVVQVNSDRINCRQGNVLDGVERQAR